MTTIEIRDRALFREVIAVGVDQLAKEASKMDNKPQVKRLMNLAEDLRRQLQRPREDVRGPVRPPVASAHP